MSHRHRCLLFFAALCCAGLFAVRPSRAAGSDEAVPFEKGVRLFSDRPYTALSVPPVLKGATFLRTSIEMRQVLACTNPLTLYAITPVRHPNNSLADTLLRQGFEQLPGDPFQLFGKEPQDLACIYRKRLESGETIRIRKWVLLLAQGALSLTRADVPQPWHTNDGEVLYNGIRLPRVWPPLSEDPASDAPMAVPYLDAPPAVIPVDIGRQLFIDDFLIDKTDLTRTYHTAEKVKGSPFFKAETSVERKPDAVCYLGHGGVFYDPADQLVKMWYSAGDLDGALAFATSRDAFHWTRPELGLPAGGNLLLPRGGRARGDHAGGDNCLWLDTLTTNRSARIKFLTQRDAKDPHWLATSPDGRSWSSPVPAGCAADYCSFFYNPFRNLWVYSVKRGGRRGRCRDYAESPDFPAAHIFDSSVPWCNADRLDEPDPVARCAPQLYSLNAVAYESLMLGIFYIHLGPPNEICYKDKAPKITELKLGFSRDGFHWQRPDRRAFIPASRKDGAWDRAYLHSTAGVCLIDGDRLLFPYCAFSGVTPEGRRGMYSGASVGFATLRRDGFASMDAGAAGGTLTTRPVTFTGKHLFVNAACPHGELRAEILDANGQPVAPYVLENCKPFTGDKTSHRMSWTGGGACPTGRPVRFRFHLKNGSLYAFWISPSDTGASRGYLAAGSLGRPSIVDQD